MLIFRKYWLATFFAFVTGLIVAIPNLVYVNTDAYRGLPMMYSDAEHSYLAKVNGAYEGCILNCNPYVREYGYQYPHSNSSLSEIVLAAPGIIFDISAINLKLFYDFFLPFVLFLLIYFLIFRITAHKWWSIIGASFIMLGYNIFNATELVNLPYIWDVVQADYTQFLHFSRPVNPQFSTIVFFIYLHILLSTITKKSFRWFVLLALAHGFSFYSYLFTAAFITVVQTVWIMVNIFRKEWRSVLCFCIATFLGLILAIPQFIDAYKLFSHPYYSTIPHFYLIQSHIPHITLVGVTLFCVAIILSIIYIKKFPNVTTQAYFVVVLVASCFVARNEHVVSGMIMQYDHFEKFLFTPVLIIACCFCANMFFKRNFHFLYFFLALIPILDSSIIQYRSYQYWFPYTNKMQTFVPVLDWLNENAPSGSVISASDELSSIIPVYTHNYILWTTLAGQWISVPGRSEDFIIAQGSDSKRLEIGRKYGADYYVEEKNNRYFVKGWRGDIIKVINK